MKEYKRRASQMDSHIKFNIDRTEPGDPKRLRLYREMVGSLTWPDIEFAVSLLSRVLVNPSEEHVKHVKHIMRCLRGTTKHGLVYRSNTDGKFGVHAYTRR